MPSQFFVKFEYQDKIKKVNVSEDQFKWDNICDLISRTFSLQEGSIKLSYKDPEGDVITACCNDDLKEAYKTVSSKQAIKFLVDKLNKPTKSKSPKKNPYHKSKSFMNPEKLFKSNLELQKGRSDEPASINRVSPKKERDVRKVNITYEEIQNIICKLLQTKEAKDEIRSLKTRLGLEESSNDEVINEFSFDIQRQKLSDSVVDAFKKLLSESVTDEKKAEEDKKDIEKSILLQSYREECKSIREEKERSVENIGKNLLDVSLKESIYGDNSHFNPIKESRIDEFMSKSFSGASSNFCKDLSSTHGVKLALRFENGKMKLMSIPAYEYSIIESSEDAQKCKPAQSPLLKRSASVNLSNKNSLASGYQGPDPDLTRLLLID